MMFQAFIDDSGRGDPKLFVLAGFIATAESWAKLSDEWQELLGMRSAHYRALECFKFSEMQSPADKERCGWFLNVILKHVRVGISVAVDVEAVSRVINATWPSELDHLKHAALNPYVAAFRGIIRSATVHANRYGITGPIDFVFDESGEKRAVIDAWDFFRRVTPPRYRRLLGAAPIFRNDKTTLPLQAADFFAGWVRRSLAAGSICSEPVLKPEWKSRAPTFDTKGIDAVHCVADESEVRDYVERVKLHMGQVYLFRRDISDWWP